MPTAPMHIERLYQAVELVSASRLRANAPALTRLHSYPALLGAAQAPASGATEAFLRCAALAHAWSTQALRLDTAELGAAIAAFDAARAPEAVVGSGLIDPVAACLGSLENAATLLHLANPARFSLWDRELEAVHLGEPPSEYHMGQARSYLRFLATAQEVIAHPLFLTFHHAFCTAHQARLQRLGIPPYPLSELRVVESAAAELARAGR
ncbi:hypothetical protein [Marichromatium gracile]|nr:hypothetical protein [Marichromatium gracile]